ncbi:MAG: pyridoxamine 5'-phosphate oxidase family protein [Thermomicrobiales bacterium]
MDNVHQRQEPQARRLELPRGYAVASGEVELLTWAYVDEQLQSALNYWLATTCPNGRPHITPVWGAWVDQALYFDGIPTARWARNLATNPSIAIHLESGADVVILEGVAEDLVTDVDTAARVVAAWDAKYGRLHPKPAEEGIFRLRPRTARAWRAFPEDATRWRFSDNEGPEP